MLIYLLLYVLLSLAPSAHSMWKSPNQVMWTDYESDKSEESKFPLHEAVSIANREAITQRLESKKFNINEPDDRGQTPLHITRFIENSKQRYAIAKLLLENNADPNIPYSDNSYPKGATILLNYHIEKDNVEDVKLLLKHKTDPNKYFSLHNAVTHNPSYLKSPVIVEAILRYGANTNQKDRYNNTPLHICINNSASFFSNDSGLEKFKSLIMYNANIGSQDKNKNTIFHVMANRKLFKCKVNPFVKTRNLKKI
jgi:ankyrin repeat protein